MDLLQEAYEQMEREIEALKEYPYLDKGGAHAKDPVARRVIGHPRVVTLTTRGHLRDLVGDEPEGVEVDQEYWATEFKDSEAWGDCRPSENGSSGHAVENVPAVADSRDEPEAR